jgi:hypothetical protein
MASKREELEAELARLKAEEERDRDEFEVEIGSEGNYARVPYRKGKAWLQKTFGIDLDEDPLQEAEPEGDKDKPKVTRFAGRRVG